MNVFLNSKIMMIIIIIIIMIIVIVIAVIAAIVVVIINAIIIIIHVALPLQQTSRPLRTTMSTGLRELPSYTAVI